MRKEQCYENLRFHAFLILLMDFLENCYLFVLVQMWEQVRSGAWRCNGWGEVEIGEKCCVLDKGVLV